MKALKIILLVAVAIFVIGITGFGLHYLGCDWKTVASIQMPFILPLGSLVGWKIGTVIFD